MSITAIALKRARFTLAAAAGLMIAGVASLFGFPATEEPTVPTRIATVEAYFPGASSERVEQLVARPIEERVREIAEVKTIDTVVRPGATYIYVSLHPDTSPERLPAVWQRLRAKASDAEQLRRRLAQQTESPMAQGTPAPRPKALAELGAWLPDGQLPRAS